MSDDDVKYLPPAAVDEQVRTKGAGHFRQGPFESENGSYEFRARSGDGETLYLKISSTRDDEFATSGIDSYQALRKLTEPDFEDPEWVDASGYESGRDIASPGFDEMDELRDRYRERIDNAASDREEREILAEMWEEAAEMELDGRDHFG
ncbi:MAG: hypothetical protein ABEK10_04140 [Candidatus Nanosalina sp.]